MKHLRRSLTTLAATAALLAGAATASLAADGVDVHCSGTSFGSTAVFGCASPTPGAPANYHCQTVGTASDSSVASVLGLLGVVAQGVDVGVGLTCTEI
ncbi:hypothetical protein AF335_09270 [Streptomyces eurocidicus]|uniref:ABC-type oligopeptide transport system substrate-binding subunit n=1 Tax=Streptomyces eurocidicus TaxID=66423 RepID=A0A2N8P0Z2_STREU|nr:hydrophobin family protein [Streptomyces eurocidicus]MBB5121836.1 ABC-type oligopeptide transport system substrate-binding subunit [Streptomyces eurocidicus]MBF6055100.1 hypothetical protein [Streptomyces eurocidicus]PNE34695.1 hypothetical protein AF335_09270 [Streptomyces eurocidicus]